MNEFEHIKSLSEKIERLMESVGKNSGRFSSIDKDLLTNYVRELYEMIVSIRPQSPSLNSVPTEIPQVKSHPYSNGEERKVNEVKTEQKVITNGDDINSSSKDKHGVKTISEIYADKNENGKATVNDKFKKQGMEIADKLKQT